MIKLKLYSALYAAVHRPPTTTPYVYLLTNVLVQPFKVLRVPSIRQHEVKRFVDKIINQNET